MLKALVIFPPKKGDLGDLLSIARAEGKKREHSDQNIQIRAILFCSELQCYVSIYEVKDGKEAAKK